LHSSVLERNESDLSKVNWLRDVILLISIVLVPWGRFSLCHTPIRPISTFPGSNLNLDCGLRDHVITRFASPFTSNNFLINFQRGLELIRIVKKDFGLFIKKILSFIYILVFRHVDPM
jgi:hypothetical protein